MPINSVYLKLYTFQLIYHWFLMQANYISTIYCHPLVRTYYSCWHGRTKTRDGGRQQRWEQGESGSEIQSAASSECCDHWACGVPLLPLICHHPHVTEPNDCLQNMQRSYCENILSQMFYFFIFKEEKYNLTKEYCANIEQHTNDSIYSEIENEVILLKFAIFII